MDNKVKGYVENVCKKCGAKFETPYFEDEEPEAAQKDYCIACIFGFPTENAFLKAYAKQLTSQNSGE